MTTSERIAAAVSAAWAAALIGTYAATGSAWSLGFGIFMGLMFFGQVIRP